MVHLVALDCLCTLEVRGSFSVPSCRVYDYQFLRQLLLAGLIQFELVDVVKLMQVKNQLGDAPGIRFRLFFPREDHCDKLNESDEFLDSSH